MGLAISRLHRDKRVSLTRIVELFSSNPARLLNLQGRGSLAPGSHADVTIFDPGKRWTYDSENSRSKSKNSPFGGWLLHGKVVVTIVSGNIVHRL